MTRRHPAKILFAFLLLMLVAISGTTPASAGTRPTGQVAWFTDLASANPAAGGVSTPTLGKDLVYAGTTGGLLAALDPDTGALVWSTDLGRGAVSAPTVGKSLVYAGTTGGLLAALE